MMPGSRHRSFTDLNDWLQVNNRCTPAAEMFTGQMELRHVRMFCEKFMHGFTQLPDTFTVDDSHTQNSPRPTLRQVIQHQRFNVARAKRVQVQHAINR